MPDSNPPSIFSKLFRWTIQLFDELSSSGWVAILMKLGDAIGWAISRRAPGASYEILDYDLTLELLDRRGKQAVFRRKQKVKFLQDHAIAYQDEAWGAGNVVAAYHCSPGVPVDVFRVGTRHLILISLRQTKNRGDIVEFNIERKVTDGFTKMQEWVEVETRYRTRRLRVTVIFPRSRRCLRAWLLTRRAERTEDLDASHFNKTADGKDQVTWESSAPKLSESYALGWDW